MVKTKKVNKLAETIKPVGIEKLKADKVAVIPRTLRRKMQHSNPEQNSITATTNERHILHKAPRRDEGLAKINTGGQKQLGINKGLYESPSAITAKARPRKLRKKI